MEIYQLTIQDLQHNVNTSMETVIRGLEQEGLLKKPANEILGKYVVIVYTRGCLGRLWDKILKKGNSNTYFTFAKTIAVPEEDHE